jgi:antitoxin (DNA-binding transcriptional repressor) of toxin-antitoxin stability system
MLAQTITLPASQVQNNFGAIVKQIQNESYSEVIVANRGKPIIALIGIDELRYVRECREQVRQKNALNQLKSLRARMQAQTKDEDILSDEESTVVANRFSHELVNDLARQGNVRFERKTM